MKTGQTVTDLGLYASDCCSTELIFETGDVFSMCPQCAHRCLWQLKEEIVALEELDRLDGLAA
jgi:hypothetical protein